MLFKVITNNRNLHKETTNDRKNYVSIKNAIKTERLIGTVGVKVGSIRFTEVHMI